MSAPDPKAFGPRPPSVLVVHRPKPAFQGPPRWRPAEPVNPNAPEIVAHVYDLRRDRETGELVYVRRANVARA